MGRMRSALRAYALESSDPATVLDRLDRKMRHFEPDAMATVLCAMFSTADGRLRISSAGHLPPVIALPGQPAELAQVCQDVLIGMPAAFPRHVTTMDFPPGAVLCLYTDGLVERRDEPIDSRIARLRSAVTTQDPEAGCMTVMAAMSGTSPDADDIALLMIRRASGAAGSPAADAAGLRAER